MKLVLRFKGYLAAIAPAVVFEAEIPETPTVGDLLEAFFLKHGRELEKEMMNPGGGLSGNTFIFVGNDAEKSVASLQTPLWDGAVVYVTSPLAGG